MRWTWDTYCPTGAAGGNRTASNKKNTVSRMGDGVFLHALRFHDPLPDVCVGAVTSVRMTPLEKVRLLRMAEKSLDILR